MRDTHQPFGLIRAFAPVACVAVVLSLAPKGSAQEVLRAKGDLIEVEKSWRARQEAFKRVEMRWKTRETYLRGGLSANVSARPGVAPGAHPDRDTALEAQAEFFLDGTKARYGYSGWQYHLTEARFNAIKLQAAFSGTATKECYPERSGEQNYPLGTIHKPGRFEGVNVVTVRPVVLSFRPLSPEFFGLDLGTFEVANKAAKVRNVACWEAVHKRGNDEMHLWTDPSKNHVVVKMLLLSKNRSGQQIQIVHRNDAQLGWVPESWSVSVMSPGGAVSQSHEATVTSLSGSTPSPALFDITFPVGTRVRDRVGDREWIVRPDESKRVIAREEFELPYSKLTEGGAAPTSGLTGGWLPLVFYSMGLVCVAVLIWRLRRRSLNSNPTS